jgi:branched-chain amino acid transport system substrate-binding protein
MEGTMLWSIHQKGYKYNFSPFPKSNDVAMAIMGLMDTIPAAQRPKKIAMFMEKGPVGMELAGMFKEQMKKYGGYDLVLHKEHTMGLKDFSSLILPAKAAGADVLIAGPTPSDGLLMVKQMKELEYFPKFFFMYRAADSWSWSQGMGKDGDYLTTTPGWSNRVKFPGVAELNKRHMEKYNRDSDVHVGPCYACVQILANAIERAGTLDRAKIRDAVASTNMTTVIGPTKFRPDGTGDIIPFVLQWQNMKSEIVWPKEQATAQLIFPAPRVDGPPRHNLRCPGGGDTRGNWSQWVREDDPLQHHCRFS